MKNLSLIILFSIIGSFILGAILMSFTKIPNKKLSYSSQVILEGTLRKSSDYYYSKMNEGTYLTEKVNSYLKLGYKVKIIEVEGNYVIIYLEKSN